METSRNLSNFKFWVVNCNKIWQKSSWFEVKALKEFIMKKPRVGAKNSLSGQNAASNIFRIIKIYALATIILIWKFKIYVALAIGIKNLDFTR